MCIKERSQLDRSYDCRSIFEEIRKKGLAYRDRTEYIYNLVENMSSHFLFQALPQRLEGSLVCSTLAYLFRGRRDLFEGLYISGTDYDFQEYTVIHLDFSKLLTDSYEIFKKSFGLLLAKQAAQNGIKVELDHPTFMLSSIIDQFEGKIVMIIDEYETPMTSLAGDEGKIELAGEIRSCIFSFFRNVKAESHRLRFFFATGASAFSYTSCFGGFNILRDITANSDYKGVFELTDEEVMAYSACLDAIDVPIETVEREGR